MNPLYYLIDRPPSVFFWAVENGLDWRTPWNQHDAEICLALSRSGNLPVLKWAMRKLFAHTMGTAGLGLGMEGCLIVKAAEHGHLHVLRWMWEDHAKGMFNAPFDVAVQTMQWETVDWLSSEVFGGGEVEGVPLFVERYEKAWLSEGLTASCLTIEERFEKAWLSGGKTAAFMTTQIKKVRAENKNGRWDGALSVKNEGLGIAQWQLFQDLFDMAVDKISEDERNTYRVPRPFYSKTFNFVLEYMNGRN
jgi:hypothetical protein